MHIASICFKCFRCFIRMLQVFNLNVAYVLQWLHACFPGVLDVCCKYFIIDVAKVDLMLHML
jgi:hypothetical protein